MIKKLLKIFNVFSLPRVVVRHRDLLRQMTRRAVEQRYRGSALGLVWSFVQPLMMLCVYTFVFSVVFKARWGVEIPGASGKGAFAVIMFCGMATLVSLVVLQLGYFFFAKTKKGFADVL